jgi:hypothetical protein
MSEASPVAARREHLDLRIRERHVALLRVYGVPTLSSMSTYAIYMWPLRAKGVQ